MTGTNGHLQVCLNSTCDDIDECVSETGKLDDYYETLGIGLPCKNEATCVDSSEDPTVPVMEYRCDCVTGWTGETCALDIDECATYVDFELIDEDFTLEHMDTTGEYWRWPVVPDGVYDDLWERSNHKVRLGEDYREGQTPLSKLADLQENPCESNSTCTDSGVNASLELGEFQCACLYPWAGERCRTDTSIPPEPEPEPVPFLTPIPPYVPIDPELLAVVEIEIQGPAIDLGGILMAIDESNDTEVNRSQFAAIEQNVSLSMELVGQRTDFECVEKRCVAAKYMLCLAAGQVLQVGEVPLNNTLTPISIADLAKFVEAEEFVDIEADCCADDQIECMPWDEDLRTCCEEGELLCPDCCAEDQLECTPWQLQAAAAPNSDADLRGCCEEGELLCNGEVTQDETARRRMQLALPAELFEEATRRQLDEEWRDANLILPHVTANLKLMTDHDLTGALTDPGADDWAGGSAFAILFAEAFKVAATALAPELAMLMTPNDYGYLNYFADNVGKEVPVLHTEALWFSSRLFIEVEVARFNETDGTKETDIRCVNRTQDWCVKLNQRDIRERISDQINNASFLNTVLTVAGVNTTTSDLAIDEHPPVPEPEPEPEPSPEPEPEPEPEPLPPISLGVIFGWIGLGLAIVAILVLVCWQAPRMMAVYRGDATWHVLFTFGKVSPVIIYGEDLVGPAVIKEAKKWAVRGTIAVVDDYDERIFSLDQQARAMKVAMKGREAKKLEVHIERMFRQRDNPDGTQSPGVIGIIVAKPSADHRVKLKMAESEFSGAVHLTDLRRPDQEEKEAFESAVRRYEAKLRRAEAQRIKLAYEQSKQTWRSVVDEDRDRRIAEAREPHALSKLELMAQLQAQEDNDEDDAGERRAEARLEWQEGVGFLGVGPPGVSPAGTPPDDAQRLPRRGRHGTKLGL